MRSSRSRETPPRPASVHHPICPFPTVENRKLEGWEAQRLVMRVLEPIGGTHSGGEEGITTLNTSAVLEPVLTTLSCSLPFWQIQEPYLCAQNTKLLLYGAGFKTSRLQSPRCFQNQATRKVKASGFQLPMCGLTVISRNSWPIYKYKLKKIKTEASQLQPCYSGSAPL